MKLQFKMSSQLKRDGKKWTNKKIGNNTNIDIDNEIEMKTKKQKKKNSCYVHV